MKKYLPINLLIISAIAFVGIMLIPRFDYLLANKSEKESKEFVHYENMLKQLDLKSDEGKTIQGKSLLSGTVILNFWASWCTPCLEEIPSLVELKKKFSDKVNILAINADEEVDLKSVKKVKSKYEMNFDNILDPNGKVLDQFMIKGLPVSIIYHNGKVIEVSKSAKDFMAIEFQEKVKSLK